MNEHTIVVALTSHDLRIENIARTAIFSIIRQTYNNIHIVLTLYKNDIKLIDSELQLLIDAGIVELLIAEKDLGPHLKYFYVMQKYRNHPIVTVDDDILYRQDMIAEFVELYAKHKCIVAQRCFKITKCLDYIKWLKDGISFSDNPTHSLFATGVGGVLYPPNCLTLSEANVSDILSIKYDDDFYLKALEVRNNVKIVTTSKHNARDMFIKNLQDRRTQSIARWKYNVKHANAGINMFKTDFLCCVR